EQHGDVVGPVRGRAVGQRIGRADPGTIRRDDPNAQFASRAVERGDVEPAEQPTVAVHQRHPVWSTELAVAKAPAVVERDGLVSIPHSASAHASIVAVADAHGTSTITAPSATSNASPST